VRVRKPTTAEIAATAAIAAFVNSVPRKRITVDEINASNREFWEEQDPSPPMLDPHEAAKANIQAAIRHQKSVEQSLRASKSRPKESPTQKSKTVEAMRHARSGGGHILDDFAAAAEAGSIDGITIRKSKRSGDVRYMVDCEEADADPRYISRRTLESWWTEAGTNTAF
jgi:hypothetical protein